MMQGSSDYTYTFTTGTSTTASYYSGLNNYLINNPIQNATLHTKDKAVEDGYPVPTGKYELVEEKEE